jgi:hypothetical protein
MRKKETAAGYGSAAQRRRLPAAKKGSKSSKETDSAGADSAGSETEQLRSLLQLAAHICRLPLLLHRKELIILGKKALDARQDRKLFFSRKIE